ncbi:hypothetical protein [Mycobacterium lepromatosis]
MTRQSANPGAEEVTFGKLWSRFGNGNSRAVPSDASIPDLDVFP